MKLTFDIPKEYSDMNRSELSQLYMKLKGVLEQIERALGNIDGNNLNAEYREKIEGAIESAAEYEKEVAGRGKNVFIAKLPFNKQTTCTVESALVTDKSIITIQPTIDEDGNSIGVLSVSNGKISFRGGTKETTIAVLVHEEVIP